MTQAFDRFFLRFAEQSHLLLCVCSGERLFYINPAYERIWGRSRETLPSSLDAFLVGIHPEDEPRIRRAIRRTSAAPGHFNEIFRVVRPDGTLRWVHGYTHGEPVGTDPYWIGIGEDITERREAELRNHASEVQLQAIAAATRDVILMLDERGCLVYCNAAIEPLLGYTPEMLLGKRLHETLVPARYRDRARRGYGHFVQHGTGPVIGRAQELSALHLNGHEIPIELSVAAARVGDTWHAVGVMRDISERKAAEAALRAREAFFHAILDDLPDLISRWRPDGRLTYVNDNYCRYFGFAREALIGASFMPLIPEEDRERLHRHIATLNRDRPIGTIEHRVIRADGTVRWQRRVDRCLFDAAGNIEEYQSTGSDITEERAAEQALRWSTEELRRTVAELKQAQSVLVRQEKLASIGTLAAGVAHEILNPLNIIGANVQLLQMDEALSPAVAESLEEMRRQIHRATKITNNLRMFSHQKRAEIVPVAIHQLLDQTLLLLAHELVIDDVEVVREYAADLPPVEADPDLLAQVFINLLTNARDAMGEVDGRQRLTLRTAREGDFAVLTFVDTGSGIPPERLNALFDPFFTTKEPGKGTGLGLAITHSIIESHGGRIDVHSCPGEGSEFRITLPLRHAADTAAPKPEQTNRRSEHEQPRSNDSGRRR